MPQSKLKDLTCNQLLNVDRILVVGDLHGDYERFEKICDLFNPDVDYIIFLGDYADRGPNGIEIIEGIHELITNYSKNIIALKGNHEDYTINGRPKFTPCDLIHEANQKRNGWKTYFQTNFNPFIKKLYLAVLVSSILFVHGGISSKIKSVNDLRYPSKSIEEDILWSDPFEGYDEHSNIRGAGVEFGKDISKLVCNRLGIQKIIRSHQPMKALDGPILEHDGRVITVSSTTIYDGVPVVLVLPSKNIGKALDQLGKYTFKLR